MKDLFPFYSIGHFINQPANPTEFEIMLFEEMEEPDVEEMHKHSFYEIVWTEKGKSRQVIDYKEYEIAANSLFFISPNQVHRFEEWQRLTGGTIMFTEDFFLLNQNNKDRLFELEFLDNFYANPCIQFNRKDFADIKLTIDLIKKEQRRKDSNQAITQSLLHILVTQAQRYLDAGSEKSVAKKYLILYKRFKVLLDQYFVDNKSAGFYAGQLDITQHHLNLIIKAVTGRTASEVIRARSLLEAKRMLTFTDNSVSEIAAHLNYLDSSYFSRLFKAETNKTPLAFKTGMSDKYRKR